MLPSACLKTIATNFGSTQRKRTTVTINVSLATLFSRPSMINSWCEETAFTTRLLCRRMAMNIAMWLMIVSITARSPDVITRTSPRCGGRTNLDSVVVANQVNVVKTATFTTPMDVERKIFWVHRKVLCSPEAFKSNKGGYSLLVLALVFIHWFLQ